MRRVAFRTVGVVDAAFGSADGIGAADFWAAVVGAAMVGAVGEDGTERCDGGWREAEDERATGARWNDMA